MTETYSRTATLALVAILTVLCGSGCDRTKAGGATDAHSEKGHSEDEEKAHGHQHSDESEDEHKNEHQSSDDHEEHDDHSGEGGRIQVSPEQLTQFGLTIADVGPGAVDTGADLVGEIRPNEDRVAHVVPRYPGIVKEVRHRIGDLVQSGDILAVIESSESLAPYELKTLIDGRIIEKHMTRGEAVDRETETFVVADLSSVWVDLSIYQKDLPRVRLGQTVRISAGEEVPEAEGELSYITPSVDQETRTATGRVVLPNPDGRWRPGMFVTARALEPVSVALVVPRSAVQTLEGNSVVFVRTDEGFEPRRVTLGREGSRNVEVVSGLIAGERVAATQSFLLKAELGKSEAEHEH
jgi:cobalt-zinc-cadmium efflux system membrane fusion protein